VPVGPRILPMMSADPFEAAVPAYVLGTLEGQDRLDFDAHLASGCAECTETVSAFGPLALALAREPVSRPIAPEVRNLLMDLAEAPSLPIDLSGLAWEDVAPGVKRSIVRHDPARGMYGTILWARPGSRYPAHRHRGDESFLVLQGHCRDDVADYGAGSVARKRPGTAHSVEFLPGEDCIGYVVSYGGHDPVE
jgi:quercetin dioxygenase-like cupin family protein